MPAIGCPGTAFSLGPRARTFTLPFPGALLSTSHPLLLVWLLYIVLDELKKFVLPLEYQPVYWMFELVCLP